jgi:1A family penicillin-binding protein
VNDRSAKSRRGGNGKTDGGSGEVRGRFPDRTVSAPPSEAGEKPWNEADGMLVAGRRAARAGKTNSLIRRRLAALGRMMGYLGVFTAIVLLATAAGLAISLRDNALPAVSMPQSTLVLDAGGNTIASLQGGVNRQTVALKNISPWLVKATLAVEDRRFYRHGAIDPRGLARAALVNMRHMAKEQGASTLTQQLARNLFLSHERTWSRKLREMWYAVQLERRYTKDEILEMYLNQIYYGHGAYGAEAAARLYYGKSAGSLTLAESALLAGIPKGPGYYSPHLHPERARARQRLVLEAMVENGDITREEALRAMREPVEIRPLPEGRGTAAPYFVDYVRRVAAEKLGIDESRLSEGGYVIRTTLDMRMQRAAEEAIASRIPGDSPLQAALVAIDPQSGHIKAMVGGRDYRRNQFNRVFAATRQPGSSFKPILYAAALERGAVTAATRFRSEPTVFYYDNDRKVYRPGNHNNRYFREEIPLRQAIRASDNIYAVHTILQVGPEAVIDMARRLGVTSPLGAVPSLALGTFPVSPFEMAAVYAVFAGGGVRVEPAAVLRIEDRKGNVLYEASPRREQILSPALAYVVTDLLTSVFDPGGTAHRIRHMLHRPVAGKSGTTASDAWFVGYTPDLVAAVWVGHDRGRSVTSTEAHRAAPIFAAFLESALEGVPPRPFPMPEGVVRANVDPRTGMLAAPDCPEKNLETFLAGTEPVEHCPLHGGLVSEEIRGEIESREPSSWWKRLRRWWGG